jgi:hypothetical protein
VVDAAVQTAVHTYSINVLWADGSRTEASALSPREIIDDVSAMVAMPALERLTSGDPDPKTSAVTISIAINPHE